MDSGEVVGLKNKVEECCNGGTWPDELEGEEMVVRIDYLLVMSRVKGWPQESMKEIEWRKR